MCRRELCKKGENENVSIGYPFY